MSDSEGSERIGNGDRDAAVAALKVHQAEGRLDSQEYEERSLKARQSRTWAQLHPLFADLPEPRPVPGGTGFTAAAAAIHGTQPVPGSGTHSAGAQPGAASSGLAGVADTDPVAAEGGRRGLIPEPYATTLVAASPILAVILFFATDLWEWFLLVPLLGIVVYVPERSGSGRDRHRDRLRDRRSDRRRN